MSRNQVKNLVAMLDEAYAGPAWYGPCLRGSLRGVTHREAAWRPAKGRHNIWELAVHAAYWKCVAVRRILGKTELRFGEPGRNFFVRPPKSSRASERETQWRRDKQLLARMHHELHAAVNSLDDSALDNRIRRLIAGVTMHDVYHAGQIQLLKRLMTR